MRTALLRLAGAVLLVACSSASYAADMYRWVDIEGHTHLADTVPDEYRSVAKRVDSTTYELSPEDQLAADKERAALLRQADLADRKQRAATAIANQSVPRGVAPAGIKSALSIDTKQARCTALRRQFDVSRNCYSRFVQANGSLRPGAAQACGPDLVSPDLECGATGP